MLDVPGASYTAAYESNDAGQIVGFYEVPSIQRSFLTTPITTVPEPATLVMGATAALVGLGYAWRRRSRAVA